MQDSASFLLGQMNYGNPTVPQPTPAAPVAAAAPSAPSQPQYSISPSGGFVGGAPIGSYPNINFSAASAIPVQSIMTPTTAPKIPAPVNNTTTANANLNAATGATNSFASAFAALTPAQKAAYTAANPNVDPTTGLPKVAPTTAAPAGGTPAAPTATAPVTTPAPDMTTAAGIKAALLKAMGIEDTKSAAITAANTAAGVDDKTLALTKLQNDAMTLKASYDNQIKEIRDNNPSGQLTGAQQETINQITKNRDQALADNAILTLVAQNNLSAAQKIADLKITAEFQPVEDKIKNLGTYFNIFQNDMTESEKMQAQAAITRQTDSMNALRTAKSDAVTKLIAAGQYTQEKADALNKATTPDAVNSALVGVSAPSNLSTTQINDGATRGGYDISAFKSLPTDVQVFYSQTSDTNIQPFKDELTKVANGDESVDDFNTFIDKQAVSANVKAYFKQVAAQAAAGSPKKTGAMSSFLNFIGWPQ